MSTMATKRYSILEAHNFPMEMKRALLIKSSAEAIAEKHMRTGRVLAVNDHISMPQCQVIDLSDNHTIRVWGETIMPLNTINDSPQYCNFYTIKVYNDNGKLIDDFVSRKVTENEEGFTMGELEEYYHHFNDDLNRAITTYSSSIVDVAYNQVGKIKHATNDAIKKATSEGIGSLFSHFKPKKKSTDIELTS